MSTVTVTPSENPTRVARKPRLESWLYRVIWRWHFYAGLFVAPVLLVAALTGGLYVFAEEIEAVIYRDIQSVTPGSDRLSWDAQLAAAQASNPDEKPSAIQYSDDPTKATAVEFHTAEVDGEHHHRYVFVNPYTGVVTGQQIYEEGVMGVILDIHRTLLAGTTGRIVVELATGWGIILAITGVYLWWPRKREKVRGVWTLRLKTKPYTLVRDLHTVPGFYISVLAVIVLVTGLFFSYFFGQGYQFATVATGGYPAGFLTPPQSVETGADPAPIGRIIDAVQSQKLHPRVYIAFPEGPTDPYTAYVGDASSPTTRAGVWVDRYSAEVLDVTQWGDSSAMFKASLLSYPLHVGSIYGLPTKILAVLVCVLIVAMTITGVIMWWMRRPDGRTGFPKKPKTEGRRFPVWLGLLVLVLGVLVPTVGMTILFLFLWDLGRFAWGRFGAKPA